MSTALDGNKLHFRGGVVAPEHVLDAHFGRAFECRTGPVPWGVPTRFWLAQSRMFPAPSSWRNRLIGQMRSGPSLSSTDPVYTPCPVFSTP